MSTFSFISWYFGYNCTEFWEIGDEYDAIKSNSRWKLYKIKEYIFQHDAYFSLVNASCWEASSKIILIFRIFKREYTISVVIGYWFVVNPAPAPLFILAGWSPDPHQHWRWVTRAKRKLEFDGMQCSIALFYYFISLHCIEFHPILIIIRISSYLQTHDSSYIDFIQVFLCNFPWAASHIRATCVSFINHKRFLTISFSYTRKFADSFF